MAKARRRLPTHVAAELRRGILAARGVHAGRVEEPPVIPLAWVHGPYPPPLWDLAYTRTLNHLTQGAPDA